MIVYEMGDDSSGVEPNFVMPNPLMGISIYLYSISIIHLVHDYRSNAEWAGS